MSVKRSASIDGWNEWSEKNAPKGIGTGKSIMLSIIGSDRKSNRLRLLSNEEFVHDPDTGNQFMIGPINKPGRPDKKTGVIEPVLYDMWLSPAQQKTWTLIGGRKEDEAIWEFIQKSSQFAGYEHRDISSEPILELIDRDAPLKKSLTARKKTRAAEKFVDGLSDIEVRAHFGNSRGDVEILRERLTIQAETNPRQFEESVNKNADIELKACVIDAEKNGIIVFDKAASKWLMDDKEIFSFKKGIGKGQGKHDQMVAYISDKDPSLFEELLKKLS